MKSDYFQYLQARRYMTDKVKNCMTQLYINKYFSTSMQHGDQLLHLAPSSNNYRNHCSIMYGKKYNILIINSLLKQFNKDHE